MSLERLGVELVLEGVRSGKSAMDAVTEAKAVCLEAERQGLFRGGDARSWRILLGRVMDAWEFEVSQGDGVDEKNYGLFQHARHVVNRQMAPREALVRCYGEGAVRMDEVSEG